MKSVSELQDISTKLQRIASLAKQDPKMVLHSLSHHIDLAWMHEAYRRTRKDGAAGVDGQTAETYGHNLEDNLRSLLERFKSGAYRAPPVRRVHIPKGDGQSTRPIGIPSFEDKVLQRAVVMVLDEVYEQDFYNCSYGFRRNRSAHQALETLWKRLMDIGGGFVVELDIASFFDTVNHQHLRSMLDQRVRDGVLRRAIGKWLNAGVLDAGQLHHPEQGTPQGGVISPLLANIYLHEVLDVWFERDVKPRLSGEAFMVRYADDAALAFANEDDARKVLEVLPKRFAKFGLQLHPVKTRLIDFRRPRRSNGEGRVGSFDLLGFTHFWGKTRKGKMAVQRKTSASRFRRALKRVAQWCREHRHLPVRDQHKTLRKKLRGHYGYYGITGNARMLVKFFYAVKGVWRRWLNRRSDSAKMRWERFKRLLQRYPLPRAQVVQSALATAAKP